MAQGRLIKQLLEYRDGILGFILALTHDLDVAEEIFQNVAMAIVEEDRRATKVTNFIAWAREVARRRVADYFKQRSRREAVEQPSEALVDVISQAFAENESTVEDHRLRLQALTDCVKKLPGKSREMVEGFYSRQLPLKQLAAEMNWQESSLRVALSRARKTLADCVNTRLSRRETS